MMGGRSGKCRVRGAAVGVLLGGWLALSAPAAGGAADPGGVHWDPAARRLSAEVSGWPLSRVLEHLAAATRWRILVEPDSKRTVTARFSAVPLGEGLKRLLGSLNYAYVPGASGRAKLLVFHSSLDAATMLVAAPPREGHPPRRIPDELILRVPPGHEGEVAALVRRLGAKITGRLADGSAYRLKFDSPEAADAARRVLERDGRFRAEDNYEISRPGRPDSLASLAIPALGPRPRPTKKGEEVIVAVVDTPVQREGTGLKDFLLPTIEVAGKAEPPPPETLSHGTSMAATILNEVAKATPTAEGTPVRILPVDVYGSQESTSSFEVARGIQAAVNAGADVVNLSLGGDGGSPLVREVIQAGRAQGVVFLGAAGNEPVTDPTFPAAFPEVVAVTAITPEGEPAPYANRGDFVDVGAPGLSYVLFWGNPYYVVGTSAATANVSGVAAALIITKGLRGPKLESALREGVQPAP